MKKINYKAFNTFFLIITLCLINIGCEGEQYCNHERKTKMSDCGGIIIEENGQFISYGLFHDSEYQNKCFYMKDNDFGSNFNGLCDFSDRIYVDESNCSNCSQLGG